MPRRLVSNSVSLVGRRAMFFRQTSLGTLVVLALLACASSAGNGRPSRGSRDVLTSDEIAAANVASAYDAIERLRPQFLRSRGATSIVNPTPQRPEVFVNNVRAGSIDVLRSIPALDINVIRFVSAADATTRHGTGYTAGIIEVTTK